MNEKVISGLESLSELAQETRANYLDTLFMDNINAAVEFGTYLVGFASIVSYEGIEGVDMRVGGGSGIVQYLEMLSSKDYKLRGLDTRQRRPQKWRYKPNYSILTRVFLDLPQLLQSSTDRAEYRQTKHINQ